MTPARWSLTTNPDPTWAPTDEELAAYYADDPPWGEGEMPTEEQCAPRCLYCGGPLLTEPDRLAHAHTERDAGMSCYIRLQEMAE